MGQCQVRIRVELQGRHAADLVDDHTHWVIIIAEGRHPTFEMVKSYTDLVDCVRHE